MILLGALLGAAACADTGGDKGGGSSRSGAGGEAGVFEGEPGPGNGGEAASSSTEVPPTTGRGGSAGAHSASGEGGWAGVGAGGTAGGGSGAAGAASAGGAAHSAGAGLDGGAAAGSGYGGTAGALEGGASGIPAGTSGVAGASSVQEPPLPDPGGVTLGGPCPLDELTGVFKLESSLEEQSILFDATVKDGLEGAQQPELVMGDGECRLLRRRHLVCDPPCPSRESCGLDETCEPTPLGQNLGTVYLAGLAETLALEPLVPGYKYFATDLPVSALPIGGLVRVRTTSGYLGQVELFGFGVEPLAIQSSAMTWLLTENEPLEVRWMAPSEPSLTRVLFQLSVDQHGVTPVRLLCDVPDTGSALVAVSLVDAMLRAGISGFPNGSIARRTVDSTASPDGCVEFQSSSTGIVNVRVAGHTPCTTQADCPAGTSCDTAMQQCG